ncbi:MAG TPA: hypothetical protein VGO93_04545 [Candidatus Xenobia bacterium]|jgi:hypothetical protein
MKFASRRSTATALALSILSFSLPTAALADAGTAPQMVATPTGNVQVWSPSSNAWQPFSGGVVTQNETFRCIEGGSLVASVQNEGSSTESITLSSCSAIRFVRLNLRMGGNSIYAKFFGQGSVKMSPDRKGIDDVKLESPVAGAWFGRDAGMGGGTLVDAVFQNPTAREGRLALNQNTAKLQGLSFIAGTVVSVDPASGTFRLKEDVSGRIDTVSLRYWSQLAKPTLQARVINESAGAILSQLTPGEALTVYGVATAAQTGSLPLATGSAAFAQAQAINFIATVVYPPGGLYIFGGTFVLSSPVTPAVGEGLSATGQATLQLVAGELQTALLPGIQLVNVACEIGNEVFTVPPPPAPGAVGTGTSIGALPIYILLGVGAGLLLIHNGGGSTNNPVFFPPFQNASP